MLDIGYRIKCMEREYSFGQMVELMRAIISKIRNKEGVSLYGKINFIDE